MEKTDEAIKIAREELLESKRALESLVNDMSALHDKIISSLHKDIIEIREARMAVQRESSDMLTALKDVRQFFLNGTYEEEMTRLERFTNTASHLRALADEGTLNAIADVMLKLAERNHP